MGVEAAFLREIQERPLDDAPRLVYADWLDEHGQGERAEFIRVQCELARLPIDDDRYPALREREHALLAQHRKAWSRPLRQYAKKFEFHRGFADHLSLSAGVFLDHYEELLALTPAWHVRLRDVKGVVEKVANCPGLARLTSLNLNSNQDMRLGARRAEVMLQSPHLGRLTALDLTNNDIGVAGMRALVGAPALGNLADLDLTHNRVGDAGVAGLVASPLFARLRRLRLGSDFVGPDGVTALAGAPHLAEMESLDLDENPVSDEGARTLASSPHVSGLRSLDLGNADLGDAGLFALASSPYLSQLHTLRLGINPRVTDEGLAALARSTSLSGLNALELDGLNLNSMGASLHSGTYFSSHVSVLGFEAFVRSPFVSPLRRLGLAANQLGPAGAEILAASPHLAGLVKLDLSWSRLGDGALSRLAASPHLGRLVELNIAGNGITGPGAEALASSPHLPRLRFVTVGLHDKISEKGMQALRDRFIVSSAA